MRRSDRLARRAVGVVLALIAMALVTGFAVALARGLTNSGPRRDRIVPAALRTPSPAPRRMQGFCRQPETRQPHATFSNVLPLVDHDVTGATAFWLPTAHGTPCRIVRTRIPRRAARRLAAVMDQVRRRPTGPTSCPPAYGGAVVVYFHLPRTRLVQRVDVSLTGCLVLDAPGRAAAEGVYLGSLGGAIPAGWRRVVR